MDESVDTDRLAIPTEEDLADPESGAAAEDFGYLLGDQADEQKQLDGAAPDDRWDGAGWTGWEDARPLDPESSGEL
ncbi:MAG TPA: hypothetical protein VE074_18195, partial [Jatrophihabitantaceae bacterium]|nr:hypothetical protein [Jatrophihabitantaceae bacterium]